MTKRDIADRKNDHIRININQNVNSSNTNGLEKFRLIHNALPEINYGEISTETVFLTKKLGLPLIISSMTGGNDEAGEINLRLARMAQRYSLAMGVGSQRIGIQKKRRMKTFKVRKAAPDILLFANIGAIQLNYGFTVDDCRYAMEEIGADAIFLHLNPLQEVLMDDGNKNFKGLLKRIEAICMQLEAPVVVKEVGWGISSLVANQLIEAGVAGIDAAGAGGTSWSEVEKYRLSDPVKTEIAGSFREWGIPTAESVIAIRKLSANLPLIASGGVRNGIDIVKYLALGANLAGIARKFLIAATESEKALDERLNVIKGQIRAAMMSIGAGNVGEITAEKITQIA